VGHSRWSWEETVKLTGVGKKGVDAVAEDEAVEAGVGGPILDEAAAGSIEVDDEPILDSWVGEGGELPRDPHGRLKGAVIPKVSPAPSQSELVRRGVWIWTNSLSYESALVSLDTSTLSGL